MYLARKRISAARGMFGGGGFSLPYSVDFSVLGDGALPSPFTGATWAVASGKAVNTPVTLGAEKLTNGDMELDANWLNSGTPTTNERSNVQKHTGTYSRYVITDQSLEGIVQTGFTTTLAWWRARAWFYGSNNAFFNISSGDGLGHGTGGVIPDSTLEWTKVSVIVMDDAGGPYGEVKPLGYNNASEFYVDDVSLRLLPIPELLNLFTSPVSDFEIKAAVTLPVATGGGVAMMWDSKTNPQNGVAAFHNGTKCELRKMVNGSWSTVITATVAYGAGKVVKVIKTGTSYSLYYGTAGSEAQIGTTQTISDTTIINNSLCGLFSVDESVGISNFFFQ
jgi:hypothetical protein